MAKIGTAHVEIKPVLNEEALNALCDRIEESAMDAVTVAMQSVRIQQAVKRGMIRALYGEPNEDA